MIYLNFENDIAAESPIGDPERTAITTGTSNTHREYSHS